ncbi:unnamed protein product (macronuclear) [Paramecium tetraurelia]|uniref:Uncharacterized protein n=1 Tax=Paramecium tetraurelia TaxID=5888 RepID=A0BDB0_PARTE|nr:uncharacterized protein GSPATT00004621001 [Paramecium tetraurelia]CAK56527.1 unnamed protein product [Paramecium tetraurelia]|eukprot:XP_001423925.1 hypothetical protein (macronuclear) [Paramecium tetraurelia strain d4-2]
MNNKNQEVCARQKLFNDQEFKEVVKTFHELIIQINKSLKKQKRKKQHQQPHQQIQKKKQVELKQFKRNSYHIQIAYKLYERNNKQNQIDECDPTYHSKKIRNNNCAIEVENQQQTLTNNNLKSNESTVQR